MTISEIKPQNFDTIRELNESAVPHVNSLSSQRLAQLAHESRFFLTAVEPGGDTAGFLMAFDQQATYDSPNFQFFRRKFEQFLYVDRIVIQSNQQGRGLGRQLYESLIELSTGGYPILTCEVNLSPPNPGSLAFHEKLGFRGVAEQETENGSKRVLLMSRKFIKSEY